MAQAQSPVSDMQTTWHAAVAAYRRRRAEIGAIQQGAALLGMTLEDAVGPELMARIEVADGVMARLSEAVRALNDGQAALVEMSARQWAVVPRAVLQELGGRFLGAWQIWVGAIAAVAALAGVFYLTNYYLEVRDAEAQNARLTGDLQQRAQEILLQMCERYPEQCQEFMQRYEQMLAAQLRAQGGNGGGNGGGLGGILAGIGGVGLAILLLMFAMRER